MNAAAAPEPRTRSALKPEIGVIGLWGLAVGLVISGEYFGWSYGWGAAGTVGFLYSTLIVGALYLAFIFSFTELTTAIPRAGGPFEYARRLSGLSAVSSRVTRRSSSSRWRRRRSPRRSALTSISSSTRCRCSRSA